MISKLPSSKDGQSRGNQQWSRDRIIIWSNHFCVWPLICLHISNKRFFFSITEITLHLSLYLKSIPNHSSLCHSILSLLIRGDDNFFSTKSIAIFASLFGLIYLGWAFFILHSFYSLVIPKFLFCLWWVEGDGSHCYTKDRFKQRRTFCFLFCIPVDFWLSIEPPAPPCPPSFLLLFFLFVWAFAW